MNQMIEIEPWIWFLYLELKFDTKSTLVISK